jgi:hypothetical protein
LYILNAERLMLLLLLLGLSSSCTPLLASGSPWQCNEGPSSVAAASGLREPAKGVMAVATVVGASTAMEPRVMPNTAASTSGSRLAAWHTTPPKGERCSSGDAKAGRGILGTAPIITRPSTLAAAAGVAAAVAATRPQALLLLLLLLLSRRLCLCWRRRIVALDLANGAPSPVCRCGW